MGWDGLCKAVVSQVQSRESETRGLMSSGEKPQVSCHTSITRGPQGQGKEEVQT